MFLVLKGFCFTFVSKFPSSVGYFVEPTVIETRSPKAAVFSEEIFGPVLTAFVYKDGDLDSTLDSVPTDTPYALTGSISSEDQ